MPSLSCVQLRQEKVQLEQTLEQEQEQQIAKLTRKIEKLEKETSGKQDSLDKVRIGTHAPIDTLAESAKLQWVVHICKQSGVPVAKLVDL